MRKPRPLAGEISGPSCTRTGDQMVPKHWISHRKHRCIDTDPTASGCHYSSHEGPHGNLTAPPGPSAGHGFVAGAVAMNSRGATLAPGRTFWIPSAITVSPGFRPLVMLHLESIRSPTFTRRISTVLSLPTTAT